jgi:transposase-like protein
MVKRGGSRRGHDAKETMRCAPRKYPDGLRNRTVQIVRENGQHGAIARVADRLDINREMLRNWG